MLTAIHAAPVPRLRDPGDRACDSFGVAVGAVAARGLLRWGGLGEERTRR
ncbi:hypothetical protein ACFPZN_14395 [Actinomadura rugatobispora]|uniref:Uncharacterized protein n=1 Tax=Actinomadura rugatobispora TaxID=1994 RepID=A0ABW0ZVV0_9ACTN|nr:hypothetical protein GCM10010200_065730 [Actinomadura rugatobispora]